MNPVHRWLLKINWLIRAEINKGSRNPVLHAARPESVFPEDAPHK